MNNNDKIFISSFVKRAEQQGFSKTEAVSLLKESGLFDSAMGAIKGVGKSLVGSMPNIEGRLRSYGAPSRLADTANGVGPKINDLETQLSMEHSKGLSLDAIGRPDEEINPIVEKIRQHKENLERLRNTQRVHYAPRMGQIQENADNNIGGDAANWAVDTFGKHLNYGIPAVGTGAAGLGAYGMLGGGDQQQQQDPYAQYKQGEEKISNDREIIKEARRLSKVKHNYGGFEEDWARLSGNNHTTLDGKPAYKVKSAGIASAIGGGIGKMAPSMMKNLGTGMSQIGGMGSGLPRPNMAALGLSGAGGAMGGGMTGGLFSKLTAGGAKPAAAGLAGGLAGQSIGNNLSKISPTLKQQWQGGAFTGGANSPVTQGLEQFGEGLSRRIPSLR